MLLPPPPFFAPRRGCACHACPAAGGARARLSVAAGPPPGRLQRRRRERHPARLLAQKLSDRLGQPFVVEDRPGAASNIAAEAVVHSPADGYTLFLAGISNAINAAIYKNIDFSFVRDVAPIGLISRSPLVMEVAASFPANTVPEFIAYAKAHPGTLNMASAGTGGATHVAGELFQMLAGIKMLHVPYRGSPPAFSDLLAGREQVMFDNVAASIALIRAGKLRALAVSSRTDALPGIPPISDFLPGYDAYVVERRRRAQEFVRPTIVAKFNARHQRRRCRCRVSRPRSITWAIRRSLIHPATSASSSPPIRQSGRRSCSSPASRRSECIGARRASAPPRADGR